MSNIKIYHELSNDDKLMLIKRLNNINYFKSGNKQIIDDENSLKSNIDTIKYEGSVDKINTDFDIKLYFNNVKNINFSNRDDLKGITLDYNLIDKKYIHILLDTRYEIDKINVIINDKVIPIKLNNDYWAHDILIKKVNDKLKILDNCKDHVTGAFVDKFIDKSRVEYLIDEKGNIEENKKCFYINDYDIEDGILDLTKYSDYNKICLSKYHFIKEIDTLIINDKLLNNDIQLHDIYINKLKAIDTNDMRLIQKEETIDINDNIFIHHDKHNNSIDIFLSKNSKIINIDENINIVERNFSNNICKDKDIKMISFNNKGIYLDKDILYIKINDESYKVDNKFKNFLLNMNKALNKEIYVFLLYSIIDKWKFVSEYNKYLEYIEKLKLIKNNKIMNDKLFYYAFCKFEDDLESNVIRNIFNLEHITKDDLEKIIEYYKKHSIDDAINNVIKHEISKLDIGNAIDNAISPYINKPNLYSKNTSYQKKKNKKW